MDLKNVFKQRVKKGALSAKKISVPRNDDLSKVRFSPKKERPHICVSSVTLESFHSDDSLHNDTLRLTKV